MSDRTRGVGWGAGLIVMALAIAGLLSWLAEDDPGGDRAGDDAPPPVAGMPETMDVPAGALPRSVDEQREAPLATPEGSPEAASTPAASQATATDEDAPAPLATLTVTGRVVDERATPIADARVYLKLSRGARRARDLPLHDFISGVPWDEFDSTLTDEEGRFELQTEESADAEGKRLGQETAIAVQSAGHRPILEPVAGNTWDVDVGELVLVTGALVSGRVVDEQRVPIAGAKVAVPMVDWFQNSGNATPRSVAKLLALSTAADGRFRSTSYYTGEHTFEVTHPGRQLWSERYVLHEDEPLDLGEIVLNPGHAIQGTVVDLEDQPLAGARVKLRPDDLGLGLGGKDVALRDLMVSTRSSSGAREEETTTDAQGHFLFDGLPQKTFGVYVHLERHEPVVQKNVGAGGPDLSFVLSPEALVVVRLIDDESGEPVAESSVRVRRCSAAVDGNMSDMDAHLDLLSATDAERALGTDGRGPGVFVLGPAGYVRNELVVRPSRHAPVTLELPGVQPGDIHEVVVRLSPAARIAGRVTGGDGQPIEGAKVEAEADGDDDHPSEDVSATTDAEGRFELTPLFGGSWTISARKSGWIEAPEQQVELAEAEQRLDVPFDLQRGAVLTGAIVQVDGSPGSGYFATAVAASPTGAPEQVRADEHGRFRFESLPPTEVIARAYPGAEVRTHVALDQETDIVLQLQPFARLHGRVQDASGERARADVDLSIGDQDWPDWETETNSRGEFVFEELAPGRFTVVARDGKSRTPAVELDLDWGQDEVVDLVFGAGAIHGVVTHAGTGEPIGGARILARMPGNQDVASPGGDTRADASGRFRLGRLVAGTYHLSVRERDHVPLQGIEVTLGAGEVREMDFELTPGGVLMGRVRTAGTPEDSSLRMSLYAVGEETSQFGGSVPFEGDYRITGLDGGRYRYEVKRLNSYPPPIDKDHVFVAGEVEIVPGQTTELDLVLELFSGAGGDDG